MTVLLRCRVEKELLKKADRVTEKLGTSTPEMIRIFLAEIVRTGKVPVNLSTRAEDPIVDSWEKRASVLESFYDPAKTW